MYVSAIILSYNSSKSIRRCLDDLITSLLAHPVPSEIFVVDNGSSDSSRGIISEYQTRYPDLIKPILFNKNTGTTFSRNAALRKATGQYILVLDSDAYISNEALNGLVRHLDSNPRTGIAAPRLTYANGNFQLSCDDFPTLLHKLKRFLFLRRMENNSTRLSNASEPIQVDYAISACWLIRRDAVRDTGLFDEKIFYSPEDVDYCLRVWDSGYSVDYLPDARVIHDAQELSRGFRLSRFHWSHLGGLLYLHRKHRYFFGLARLHRRLGRFRNNIPAE